MYKASIIIPAYNAENYIFQTIESILAQTFVDFECIVIDDGSTDDTLGVVKAFNDSRIKIVSQKNSGGPAGPRNVGIKNAQGKYIFIFDSDDIMHPEKVASYVDIFEANEGVDFLFSDFSLIDEKSEVLTYSFLSGYEQFRSALVPCDKNLFSFNMNFFLEEIIYANFIGTSSVAFKRSSVKNINLFEESLASGDDILAWVKLAKESNFYFIDRVFHQYRKREGSISSANAERLLGNKIIVLDRINSFSNGKVVESAIVKKKNEYYFSLGYFYFKNGNFEMAKATYFKMQNVRDKPKMIYAIFKTYIAQILSGWRK